MLMESVTFCMLAIKTRLYKSICDWIPRYLYIICYNCPQELYGNTEPKPPYKQQWQGKAAF